MRVAFCTVEKRIQLNRVELHVGLVKRGSVAYGVRGTSVQFNGMELHGVQLYRGSDAREFTVAQGVRRTRVQL